MNRLKLMPFYYIRHGESEGNVLKLCQGQLDFALTELGRDQAHAAAESLRGRGITTIYFSPLSRAAETAQIIADSIGVKKTVAVSGLKERSWGVFEGKSNLPMFEQEERERSGSYDDASDTSFESKSKFCLRIKSAMDEVLQDTEENVAIVGHGRFFNSLCDLMQTEVIRQIPNASPVFCKPDASGGWTICEVVSTR